jgi:hypothetical protein
VVAINNAWRLRKDWDYIIFPEDFPKTNQPKVLILINSFQPNNMFLNKIHLVDLFMQGEP